MNTADNEDNNVVSEGFVLYIKSERIVNEGELPNVDCMALLSSSNESSLTLKRKSFRILTRTADHPIRNIIPKVRRPLKRNLLPMPPRRPW